LEIVIYPPEQGIYAHTVSLLLKINYKKMKKRIVSFLMSALMLTLVSCGTKDGREDSTEVAEDQNEEQLDNKTEKDADFAVEAADAGLLEVQMSTLALTKASSPQVKQFAQTMVNDHTKAHNELEALAQQKNITLPTVMGDQHQRKYDNCKDKTGAEFDKEYMDLMVKEHKQAINKFEDQAEDGNDPEIKTWASGKLAVLRQHLEHAERTHEAVKDKKNP
jgi:putative membrane protein